MAKIRFLYEETKSLKQSKPPGRTWRRRFWFLLSLIVIENIILLVTQYV